MDSYTVQGVLIFILVVLSALFSGSETALMTFGTAGIHRLLDDDRPHSRLIVLWRDHPNQVIAALLVLNNLVNILASSVATNLAAQALDDMGVAKVATWSVAIAVGVMTFVIVTFGEVLPKTFAKHNADRLVVVFPVVYMLCTLVRPFASVLRWMAGGMISAAGGQVRSDHGVTEAEIETMIRLGSEKGALSGEKQRLLASVIEFSETMVKEIMVPRTDVVGFPADATETEVLKVVADRKFSRYPAFDGDLDSIIGIVTVKDLLGHLGEPVRAPFSIGDLAKRRKTLFVPDSKKIGDLLKEFQEQHVQMAVVVDEFGGTAGIVTMEDVIEEIVGEIYDEHEKTQEPIREVGPGRYLVQARTAWEDIAALFDVVLAEQDIYESVGGLVLTHAGHLPERGETIDYAGLRFEVRERTRTRLVTLCVSRTDGRPDREGSE